jgi:hypothetical protein
VKSARIGHSVCGHEALFLEPEGGMTEERRDENDRTAEQRPSIRQDEEVDEQELARRRESARRAQLTSREREARWPIG